LSRDRRSFHHIILAGAIYLVSMVLMIAFGDGWRWYHLIHGSWTISFLALMYLIIRSGWMSGLSDRGRLIGAAAVALISLCLHLAFLLREPSLSQDILLLVRRGNMMLDGQFPYRDFQPNKPPLYIWMVGLISILFGPHQITFRIVFSAFDALIPAVMMLMSRDLKVHAGWGKITDWLSLPTFGLESGAFMYALCPIPLLEVGLAGHFDPSVVLVTLLSFWALTKRNVPTAGLLLGAGLSLKVYPIFIFPVMFLSIRSWADRAKFLLAFLIVPVVSSAPILLVHPEGIIGYFEYQTVSWYSGVGIRSIFEWMLGSLGLPEFIGFFMMSSLLIGGCAYIYLKGALGGLSRRDLDFISFFAAGFAFFLIHYSFIIMISLAARDFGGSVWKDISNLTTGIVLIIISYLELSLFVLIYIKWRHEKTGWGRIGIRKLLSSHIPLERTPLMISAVILLLLLASAQFHPWYLLWIIPFLSLSPPQWSWSLLLLFSLYQSSVYKPVDVGHF